MLILKLRKTNIIMGAHRLHFIVLLVCYLPCLVLSRRLPLAPRIPENFSSFELPSIKDPKIIGGETVKNGEAPYQVAIIRNGAFHCGGVWIDAKRVLTAAHCVIGYESRPHLFRIRYGTLYRNGGLEMAVSRIIRHPGYSSSTIDYDVAVLCTETPFTLGPNAQIVPAIASTPPVPGTVVQVSGWGRVHQNSGTSLPIFLQRAANLTVVSQTECQSHWLEMRITERMMCAFSLVQATCTGDSGGPLVHSKTGQLVGIVSFGSTWCLHPTHPGVYARVDTLRDWILDACAVADSGPGSGTTLSYLSMTMAVFNPFLASSVSLLYSYLSDLWS